MAQQQQVKLGQPVNRRLGDLLVADGLLTAEQLKKALAEQKGSPEKLGSVLIRLNFVNEDQLIGFLSRQYGVPSITLGQLDIDPDVLKLVPAPIARKYEVIPVRRMGNSLALAMADPTNVFALDDISFMTNLQVLPLVASQTAIKKAVDRNYESKTEAISSVLSDMQTDLSNVEVVEDSVLSREPVELLAQLEVEVHHLDEIGRHVHSKSRERNSSRDGEENVVMVEIVEVSVVEIGIRKAEREHVAPIGGGILRDRRSHRALHRGEDLELRIERVQDADRTRRDRDAVQ